MSTFYNGGWAMFKNLNSPRWLSQPRKLVILGAIKRVQIRVQFNKVALSLEVKCTISVVFNCIRNCIRSIPSFENKVMVFKRMQTFVLSRILQMIDRWCTSIKPLSKYQPPLPPPLFLRPLKIPPSHTFTPPTRQVNGATCTC